MAEQNSFNSEGKRTPVSTLRDFLAIGFRQRRLIAFSFFGIFLGAILLAFLLPAQYESQLKILVRRERVDSVVSPDRNVPVTFRAEVSEAEMQSEAELLQSRDLLEKVVIASGLDKTASESSWAGLFDNQKDREANRIAKAVIRLEKKLSVNLIKKTNLISVTYTAPYPQLAARVLNTLANFYLEKHVALHRNPGSFEFFQQQAEGHRKALTDAEARLADFEGKEGVVVAQVEKDITVRKLADFEAKLREMQASIAEAEQRIHTLETQLASVPSRQTTAVRTSDNPMLMERLKSTLLELELKRTELLAKYEPAYPPVQQVEQQIAQARAAIAAAQKEPLRDETTNRDPTHEWLRVELAKANAELAALRAGASATADLIRTYRADAQRLSRKETIQQDLLRAAKTEEEKYLLYLGKQEEARISDALDRQRIANVAIAEAATVPILPESRRGLIVALGGLLAGLVSVVLAFTADYWDPSFRTPDEVEAFLDSPVVAAIPKNAR